MGSCTPLSYAVSARVRAAIEAADRSLADLSRSTGIPRETLRRKLTGAGSFTIAELETVALELGLDPDAFVDSSRWTEAS